MTRTGRNNTLAAFLTVMLFFGSGVLIGFFANLESTSPTGQVVLDWAQWRAVGAAMITAAGSGIAATVYMRVFRRSPSVPVFFVVLFFIFTMLDITKVSQVLIPASSWRNLSPLFSRVTIFGHLAGALALFAAGLYASVSRMQRHGTALLLGCLTALGLSWAIPIDTLVLPDNLVYSAGFQVSLDNLLHLVMALAVLNFVQAAVSNRDRRHAYSAVAVILLVLGREMLFYYTGLVVILVGFGLYVLGAAIFAIQNYRDYLLS